MASIENARRSALTTLQDVQLQAVDTLLKAWSAELAKSWQSVIEEGQRLEQESAKKAIEQARQHSEEVMDAALDAQVEHYLQGLRALAHDKSFHVAIPEGCRAASTTIQGPSFNIDSLIADIQFEDRDARELVDDLKSAQTSAAWAFGQGLMPHPADLSLLLQSSGADAEWSARFGEVAKELGKLDSQPTPNLQLKMIAASERIDALKEYCELLNAYSPERLVTAIANPIALPPVAGPAVPTGPRGQRLMPPERFAAMLNAFQKPSRS